MNSGKPSSVADQVLLARCETWRDFVEQYANDITSGGLFVATEQNPPALSTVDVRVQLPEATEIVLRARVVQVLGAEQAKAQNKPVGVGLELLEMDAERKRQIYQLIEFARWQGATNDPNASFARTLLEISPSLAPAEVGHRLSLLPGAPPRANDGMPSTIKSGGPIAKRAAAANSQQPNARVSGSAPHATPRDAGEPASSVPVAAPAPPATPPKPSDPVKLKLLLTEFAHKQYDAALRTTREMLESNPGDLQALRWQHMSNARLALTRNDTAAAAEHYEQALPYDEDNREAREFVRNHRRDKKLNSIPFGRYFTKKK